MKIKHAMNSEHRGSAMKSPNFSMSTDDTITPTLPIVSATTWRNTPEITTSLMVYKVHLFEGSIVMMSYNKITKKKNQTNKQKQNKTKQSNTN